MCLSPPYQCLSDIPCGLYICFGSYPMRGVSTKSIFSNDVSTGKGDFWDSTSSFVFVPQYSWIYFFIMWSVWSIMIPYLLWIMLILSSFILGPSWNLYSKRVSNPCIRIVLDHYVHFFYTRSHIRAPRNRHANSSKNSKFWKLNRPVHNLLFEFCDGRKFI